MSTTIQKLNIIINEILGEEVELSPDTFLRDVSAEQANQSLGLSSIDIIDLVSQAEIEFDVEVNESELVGFKSISDLIKFIEDNQ